MATATDAATDTATNGATKKKEDASLPRPVFTNAEAGALEFPSSDSRIYNYYKPRRTKGTMYEDVTVEVQPDPAHYLSQDWVYAFHDGVAGFPASWTALKSSDWHTFRDPNEEWEKTIYYNNANVVRQISRTSPTPRRPRPSPGGIRVGSRWWHATWAPPCTQSTGWACTSSSPPSGTPRPTCTTTPSP